MSKAMTRKAWLEYLQKAVDEFDWEAAGQEQGEPVAYIHRNEYNEYRLEPHDNFDIKSIPFNVDVPLFKESQPAQRPKVVFPTMLRKMWSGGEVQAWLDENVNKGNNNA